MDAGTSSDNPSMYGSILYNYTTFTERFLFTLFPDSPNTKQSLLEYLFYILFLIIGEYALINNACKFRHFRQ